MVRVEPENKDAWVVIGYVMTIDHKETTNDIL